MGAGKKRRWTSAEDRELEECLGAAWSHAKIGKRLGRTGKSVATRAARLRLKSLLVWPHVRSLGGLRAAQQS